MSESDPDFDRGFDESCEPSFGAFAGYFLDDDFRETISPFLDITIEGEELMLRELYDSEDSFEFDGEEGRLSQACA
jgi:hypothetical protein